MPITLNNPIVVPSKQGSTFKVRSIEIDFDRKKMSAWWAVEGDGRTLKNGSVTVFDDEEKKTTEFSDFYNNWASHQELVELIARKANLQGSYKSEELI